jgi:hypothetical protein
LQRQKATYKDRWSQTDHLNKFPMNTQHIHASVDASFSATAGLDSDPKDKKIWISVVERSQFNQYVTHSPR